MFGFSIYSISSTYFFIELIVGVLFILHSSESYKAAFLVQLFITGIYAILLFSNMIANERTAGAEEKRQYEIAYIKKAASEIESIMDEIKDRETKRKIEKVYDAINSSPVKSNTNLMAFESQLVAGITDLKNIIGTNNRKAIALKIESILAMVNERNRQLKLYN